MPSSAMHMSLSAIFSITGISLLLFCAITDYWIEIEVNRREIIAAINRDQELSQRLKEPFVRQPIYFTRNQGLFHLCFSDAVPSDIGSFDWLGNPCISQLKDYMPDEAVEAGFNSAQAQRLWFSRGMLVAFAAGLLFFAFSFLAGLFGCIKRSTRWAMATALALLFSVLLISLGMACWHYVFYMERYVLDVAPYFKNWDPLLKDASHYAYSWGYVLAWAGIGCLALSSFFMFWAYKAMKDEEEQFFDQKHAAYMMPNYYDKGTMVPYGYNTYSGAFGGYPAAGYYQYPANGYYGYMTYGR